MEAWPGKAGGDARLIFLAHQRPGCVLIAECGV